MSHSSIVTLELCAGRHRVNLAQIAHDFAITAEPCELPAGDAEILMTVDGDPTLMPVRIDRLRLKKGARFRLYSVREPEEHSNSKGGD